VPADRIRVTNAERQDTVERLGRALADGCVTPVEFDERVSRTWAATTRGDLTELVEDLPPDRPGLVPTSALGPAHRGHPALRAITAAWLILSAVSIMLWAVMSVATGITSLWWVWIVGPSGITLSTLWYACDQQRAGNP
jgi:hypothetical protein